MTRREPRTRARTDWEAARRKFAVRAQSPEADAEAAELTLRARAERLAVVIEARPAQGSAIEVLIFERAGRRYAVESRFVIEVGACGKLTRLPGAQPSLLGVTNLRGDVLPVFDFARVWEGKNSSPPLTPQLVVLGAQNPDLGVLADTVDQVSEILVSSLSNISRFGVLQHTEYTRGVTDQGCLLIAGDAVLLDRKLFVAAHAANGQPEKDRN
jgi:purine-binding chemotaxis protein CheW